MIDVSVDVYGYSWQSAVAQWTEKHISLGSAEPALRHRSDGIRRAEQRSPHKCHLRDPKQCGERMLLFRVAFLLSRRGGKLLDFYLLHSKTYIWIAEWENWFFFRVWDLCSVNDHCHCSRETKRQTSFSPRNIVLVIDEAVSNAILWREKSPNDWMVDLEKHLNWAYLPSMT